MKLLQLKIDAKLGNAIEKKAKLYGIPKSSLIRIVLVKSFLEGKDEFEPGNIFNAPRDNKNKGIFVDKLIRAL